METKPILKEYLNVQQYLEDLYKYRKSLEDSFSYESWSQELGINNRSYLRLIVTGRRALSDSLAEIIRDRLNLHGSDREYFETLVLYSKARSKEQRHIYGKRLAQLMKTDVKLQEMPGAREFILNPLWPRLQTLLSFQDTPKTAAGLAQMTKKSVQEIEAGLVVLNKLELITQEDNGEWKVIHESFRVRDELGNINLLQYHADSLQDAIEATSLAKEQRRYKSLLMALNKEEFQDFLEDFQVFVGQALTRYNHDQMKDRRLFQVNFNLHSVSESIDPDLKL